MMAILACITYIVLIVSNLGRLSKSHHHCTQLLGFRRSMITRS